MDSQAATSEVRAPVDGTGAAQARAEELRASPPLFASPTLDRLTRVHPIVPLALYGPVVAGLLAWGVAHGAGGPSLGLIALGYVLWTLTEYWLHRVVFHFEPDHGLGMRLHYLIHGVHHDHPNDPRRLVMPPSASVPLAVIFCLLFAAVFGDPNWQLVAAGFVSGYIVYDMLHYLLHHRVSRNRIGRLLRERHMRHHFQDDTRGFGVSAPYWDRVFGTTVRRRSAWREPVQPTN
jgi:sterol desaturase/sphingolipid hydroxylase (fatty acid hydroxylase superfamily)